MHKMEVNNYLANIIQEYAGITPEEYKENSLLKDLGLDSLDLMDIMVTICDEFDFPIESVKDEANEIKTVADIKSFIEKHYDKRSTAVRSL